MNKQSRTPAVQFRCVASVFAMFFGTASIASPRPPLQFEFGVGGNVSRRDSYIDERGFGFEAAPTDAGSAYFSVKLPEANYRVTIRFGDARVASHATVKAETRRLMLEEIATDAGQFVTRSFIVNVRTPALPPPPALAPGGSAVRLAPGELESRNWDEKLTLEFEGRDAKIATVSIEPVTVPTVYLLGDSTVADQSKAPSASWGQMLPRMFGPNIAIANHARSGDTLKSFVTALRFDKVLSTLRSGDWVLIQFGHNDQKSHWPQTYVEASTTYRAYLRAYIAEARRRGATPILITSPERRNFDGEGRIVNSHGDYPDAVRAVAREESVAIIDLHAMSTDFYEALGPKRARSAFADEGRDLTHHNEYGAYELARMVASGIRAADVKLASYLADDVPAQRLEPQSSVDEGSERRRSGK